MASSIVEKIDEKFLKCGICLDNFNSPRALPCLHSFCEECLEGWAKKSEKQGVLTCPKCMKETAIPEEGIKGFPAHFLVSSLQETVETERKGDRGISQVICTTCNIPGKVATVRCLDCKEFMCEICHFSHKNFKAFKDHQVVTMEDLKSGKAAILVKKTQDKYCEKHDGEQKRFYCETCEKPVCRDCIVMKQCCRDHDYSTLSEASQSKASNICELIGTCHDTMKKYQTAITKTNDVQKNLISGITRAEKQLASEKESFILQLNNFFSKYQETLNLTKEVRTKDLSDVEKELKDSLAKIESACELGRKLTDSGSDFEILSNYASTMKTLQEVSTLQAKPADDGLAQIQITPLPYVVTSKQWEKIGEFKTHIGGLRGVTVTPQNNIALLRFDEVEVFSKSGDAKLTFTIPTSFGITSRQDGKYVIAGWDTNQCHIYDTRGEQLSSFPICDTNNKPSKPWPVAMDNQGNIIVGSLPNTLSIHSTKGALISKFEVTGIPHGLTVTRNGNFAITYHSSPRFQLIDSSGNILKISQQPLEVKEWKPNALCRSKRDEVFVTNDGEPKGVYMYTAEGDYLGCVTTEVGESWGIALSQEDQELYVAERQPCVVKIFKRP